MAQKVREGAHDPVTAESLIPKDHGFVRRRVPSESGYLEAFNDPRVYLINFRETPISRVT